MKQKWVALLLGLGMMGSASAALAADAASGKAIYEKSCVGCHGADAKGNAAMTKVMGEGLNLTTKETAKKSDDQLMKALAEGQGKMPAQKLNKDEQKAVVGYVRSLSK